jgi:hypothetical protein
VHDTGGMNVLQTALKWKGIWSARPETTS